MQVIVLVTFLVALTLSRPQMLAETTLALRTAAPGLESWAQTPWAAPVAVSVYLLVALGLTRWHVSTGLGTMSAPGGPSRRARRLHALAGVLGQCWLPVGLGAAILLGYGRWVVVGLGLADVPLVPEVMALLPFFAAVLLVWLVDYPFYRETRRRISERELLQGVVTPPPWSRAQYLIYNTRHHLLFIAVPVLTIVLISDLLYLLGPVLPPAGGEYILLGLMVTSSATVFLLAPALIVRIWQTEPLEDGALRRELEATCRTMRLGYRDLLVWRSGGMIANAGVMGLIPRVRYVLLSDGLLDRMSPRHIRAIFAHEAGHIVHRHILYAAVFAVASVLLTAAGGEVVVSRLGWGQTAGELFVLALLGAVWGFGFGWLSRRFERQSDVMAAWSCSPAPQRQAGLVTHEGALQFAEALARVGQLNGIQASGRNWRHGSIEYRINYILCLADAGRGRGDIDRTVRRIKRGLWLALAAAVGVTIWMMAAPG